MKNKQNRKYMGIVMVAALFAVVQARAGIKFGIGLTPHGTRVSVDYRDNGRQGAPRHAERRYYRPAPAPARRCAPVVVVDRRPTGRYVNQVERYWVEGYWTNSTARHGRVVRTWNPGYWAERTVRVWVQY